MISVPTENEWTVTGMAENRDRSCYTCFHRHACAGMMEAQGLADYVSLGAQSAERCPDYIYSGDVATVRHGKNIDAEWPSLFRCSACGWSDGDITTGDTMSYNYCPNCGAKMDLKDA